MYHIFKVHGGWTEFGNWTICSRTCETGERKRVRTCSNPEPDHGGTFCKGPEEEIEDCNPQSCLISKFSAA